MSSVTTNRRRWAVSAALALVVPATLLLLIAPAAAQQEGVSVTAYINPDVGEPTELSQVDPRSSCDEPVTSTTQPIGEVDAGTNNVHIDGCVRGLVGTPIDTQVSFESSGVGTIFACPDPGEGKSSSRTADRCTLTGYEDDNLEYHVRVVSDSPGTQTVTMCVDEAGDGCADADETSTVTIEWAPAGAALTGGIAAGVAPAPAATTPVALQVSAVLLTVAAAVTWRTVSLAGRAR
jgi:hypothetical protein